MGHGAIFSISIIYYYSFMVQLYIYVMLKWGLGTWILGDYMFGGSNQRHSQIPLYLFNEKSKINPF